MGRADLVGPGLAPKALSFLLCTGLLCGIQLRVGHLISQGFVLVDTLCLGCTEAGHTSCGTTGASIALSLPGLEGFLEVIVHILEPHAKCRASLLGLEVHEVLIPCVDRAHVDRFSSVALDPLCWAQRGGTPSECSEVAAKTWELAITDLVNVGVHEFVGVLRCFQLLGRECCGGCRRG